MARPVGSRDARYREKRAELLGKLEAVLASPAGHTRGFRALAEAAGVSYPTLRHYFGTRDGLIAAYLSQRGADGAPYLLALRQTDLPFADSIRQMARDIVGALAIPAFRAIHTIGLREGLLQPSGGAAYLTAIFEPTLQALEARLVQHMERGDMATTSPRSAALAFLSPLLLAGLHQHSLTGADMRPLDLASFAEDHARAFVRAFGQPSHVVPGPV